MVSEKKRVAVAVPTARRAGKSQVVQALKAYCVALQPGERIPTHTELMRQLQASERAVQAALAVLQEEGKIVRKNGVGTFVAEAGAEGIGKSLQTLVVLARPDHSFFDRFLDLLFRYAEQADLKLVCLPVDTLMKGREEGPDTSALRLIKSLSPLGCLLFGYTLMPLAKQLQDSGQRVVLIGAPPVEVTPDVPCIYNDHEFGGYLTTNHLIELGHRRIAYTMVGTPDLQQSRRWRGHQRALQEARRAGHSLVSSFLLEVETNVWASEPEQASAFFKRADAPTALVAWNDYEAIRLLAVLSRAGVQVPAQVSLMGYDALPGSNLVYPSLTTVEHGMRQQLAAAIDLLTCEEPLPPTRSLVFMPGLVPRESTTAPNEPLLAGC